MQSSTQESTELTVQTESISLYTDDPAGVKDIIKAATVIKKSFPSLPQGFYDILGDRIRANNFTAQRLRDAVTHVIDNCVYPTPTIANFISFDRTLKFKTHEEMCKEALTYEQIWKQWLPVKFPNLPRAVWVFENDIVKYKLEGYLVNKPL